MTQLLTNAWTPPGPAMLFCPADRPDRYRKALDRADVVILDLEDAVGPENRPAAREALIANPIDPDRVVVRINPATTGDYRRDLAAVAETDYRVVMQAKSETPESVIETALQTIALVETPFGATRVNEIAAVSNCIGLMWGAEDLVAGLGGKSSRVGDGEENPGTYRDVARWVRSVTRLAAAATRYADQFGFGFVMYVGGSTATEVLTAIDDRRHHDEETERPHWPQLS